MSRRTGKDLGVDLLASALLDRLDRSGGGRERGRAVAAWFRVAGRDAAAHARGFALREGELLVFVDSAVWANDLAMMSEHYRAAINTVLGKETVRAMRFAVSRKAVPEREAEGDLGTAAGGGPKSLPCPATETEIAQIRQMAAAVHDEGLREAVIAAAITHLGWRKGIEARIASENAAGRSTDPETGADH